MFPVLLGISGSISATSKSGETKVAAGPGSLEPDGIGVGCLWKSALTV